MPPRYRWRDPQGSRTIAQIVKKEIPEWTNGLYPSQQSIVVRVLDGEDVLCCMATGGGKSAMFAVPIIVLREMARNPELYPDLPVRALPIGIVITPTKGLAANIVLELKKLRVPAFSYCHDTVTHARKHGRNLVRDIKECKTWSIVCVDPEHLRDKAWREISAFDIFRTNIVFGCVDEAHLINEWGPEFRPLFKHIGAFFRGRLPSSASIMALSATLQPGTPSDAICTTLGMSGDDFHIFRSSNERPNTQFIMEPLEHGIGGNEFPELLRYINSGRKAVVHCRRIDDVFRLFVYLWKAQVPGPNRLRRVQMYHSLRSSEDNEEILRLLDEDPSCQIVIATIAFANGLNVKALLDSLSLGFPDTVDQLWQEKGRVGRNPDTAARGVVFFQPKSVIAAQKQIDGLISTDTVSSSAKRGGKAKYKKKPKPMERAKALILIEKNCYIAALNRVYQNPPQSVTYLDCIAAKRILPCSLCATRSKATLEFPAPPLPPGITLPPFDPSLSKSTNSQPIPKKFRLTKIEREEAEPVLIKFGETVRIAERKHSMHDHRPKSSFFPTSIVNAVLTNLLTLDSLAALTTVVQSWVFSSGYINSLNIVVQKLREKIDSQRERARIKKNEKQRATRRAKKSARDMDSEEEDEELSGVSSTDDEPEEHSRSSPIPPPAKRSKPALVEVTNQKRPPRARPPKKALESAAAVSETYRPQYRTSRRRGAGAA